MKKISNLLFILFITLMFQGCVTALLLTGTVIGGAYVVNEIDEDYDGDAGEFVKDKSNKAYDAITGD